MSVAGTIARADFQKRLLASANERGLAVEQILRIYQPLYQEDAIECLIVDHDAGAVTVWADPTGKITRGPEPGFGREPKPDTE